MLIEFDYSLKMMRIKKKFEFKISISISLFFFKFNLHKYKNKNSKQIIKIYRQYINKSSIFDDDHSVGAVVRAHKLATFIGGGVNQQR